MGLGWGLGLDNINLKDRLEYLPIPVSLEKLLNIE